MAARRAELKRTDATAKNVRDQTRGGRAARRPALGWAAEPSARCPSCVYTQGRVTRYCGEE